MDETWRPHFEKDCTMNNWRKSRIGDEIELAYGKSLPARAREAGPFEVFGSNGCVGNHSVPLVSGPGIIVGRKGSAGQVAYSNQDFWAIDTTYYVVNKNGHNWRFLYHLLSCAGLDELNSHSAVPGLNREIAYSVPISLPEKTEQEKIASVLDTVEHAVQHEDLAIGHTQELKRAAMRELFTRGLRGEAQEKTEIGLMPESWEILTVAEAVRPFRFERKQQVPKSEYAENGCWPIIDQGQDFIGGYIDDETRLINSAAPIIIFGDHTRIFKFVDFEFALGAQGTKPLLAEDGFNSKYLYYALCNLDVPPRGYNRHYKILSQMHIGKPDPSEQREIVTILDTIDRKIDLHQRKRAVLDDLFKALLHKLMTGEIRVGDLDLRALIVSNSRSA